VIRQKSLAVVAPLMDPAAGVEAMRRILIDQARQKQSQRRGGGRRRQDIEHQEIAAAEPSLDVSMGSHY
jgi:ECF sigma factor